MPNLPFILGAATGAGLIYLAKKVSSQKNHKPSATNDETLTQTASKASQKNK